MARYGTSIKKALVFDSTAYDTLSVSTTLMNTCFSEEYLASKSHGVCDPKNQYAETIIEAQTASCIMAGVLQVALSIASNRGRIDEALGLN